MLKEFREFINRGNVLDLAVAVVIGGAFGAIVTSLVDDILMPLVGVLLGGINFTGLNITMGGARILYGNFIQAIVNFLVIAFAMFLVVRTANRVTRKKEAAPPAATAEVELLTEIRDLLKDRS